MRVSQVLARRQDARTTRNAIALGVAAFAACTIHFYGIITVTLLAAGAVVCLAILNHDAAVTKR